MTVANLHASPSLRAPSPAEQMLEDERSLYRRIVARDELALLESFDRSGHLVFCTALLLSGESSTAEDLTEELFAELWRSPEGFAPTHGPLGLQMIRRLTDRVSVGAAVPSVRAQPAAADRAA